MKFFLAMKRPWTLMSYEKIPHKRKNFNMIVGNGGASGALPTSVGKTLSIVLFYATPWGKSTTNGLGRDEINLLGYNIEEVGNWKAPKQCHLVECISYKFQKKFFELASSEIKKYLWEEWDIIKPLYE